MRMLKTLLVLSLACIVTIIALKFNIVLGVLCIVVLICFGLNKLFGDADIKLDPTPEEDISVSTNPSTGAPMMGSTDILGHKWGE